MGKLRGEELHQIYHISTAITNLQSGALCETLLRGNFMRNREQGYRSDKHNAEKI